MVLRWVLRRWHPSSVGCKVFPLRHEHNILGGRPLFSGAAAYFLVGRSCAGP